MNRFYLVFAVLLHCFTAFSQCTEAKDPEMAKYMNLTKTRDPQGCSECGMLALYFCSAKYTVAAEDKAKVSQLIEACKSNIRQMGEPYCCPDYLNKQPEWGSMAGKTQPAVGKTADTSDPSKVEKQAQQMAATADVLLDLNKAGVGAQKAAAEMQKSTLISSDLETKEQIEADYAQKVKSINQSADQLKKSEDAKTQSYLDTGATGITDSNILGGISSAANYIHALEAEAERKKALDRLEFQKLVALRRLENEKEQQKIDSRLGNPTNVGKPDVAAVQKVNDFKAYGHELGISVEQAKKQYRDFFKKAVKPVVTPYGSMITSKLKAPAPGNPQAFYTKNNTITGHKIIVGNNPFDPGFETGFATTRAKLQELEALFGFSPVLAEGANQTGNGTCKRYIWQTQNRIVELEFNQIDMMGMFQLSEVFLSVFNQ